MGRKKEAEPSRQQRGKMAAWRKLGRLRDNTISPRRGHPPTRKEQNGSFIKTMQVRAGTCTLLNLDGERKSNVIQWQGTERPPWDRMKEILGCRQTGTFNVKESGSLCQRGEKCRRALGCYLLMEVAPEGGHHPARYIDTTLHGVSGPSHTPLEPFWVVRRHLCIINPNPKMLLDPF